MDEEGAEQEVTVRTLDGQTVALFVPSSSNINDLKHALVQKSPFKEHFRHFHLFLRGSRLNGNCGIRSLSLKRDEFIVLIPSAKTSHNEMHIDVKSNTTLSSEKHDTGKINKDTELGVANSCGDIPGLGAPQSSGRATQSCVDSMWHDIFSDITELRTSYESSNDSQRTNAVGSILTEDSQLDGGSNTSQPPEISCTLNGKKYRRRLSERANSAESVETVDEPEHTMRNKPLLLQRSLLFRQVKYPSKLSKLVKDTHRELKNLSTISDKKPDDKRESCKKCSPRCYPPFLQRQMKIFTIVNVVSGFLQKHDIQSTWTNVRGSLEQLCCEAFEEVTTKDIEMLAALCPKLMALRHMTNGGNEGAFSIEFYDSVAVLHENVCPKKPSERSIIKTISNRQKAYEAYIERLVQKLEARKNFTQEVRHVATFEDLLFVANSLQNEPSFAALEEFSDQHHVRTSAKNKSFFCMDSDNLTPSNMVEHLRVGLGSKGQIVHVEKINSRKAKMSDIQIPFSEPTSAALKRIGISRFYSHQSEAIQASLSGENVVIATSTASGKSLCYNVPVMEILTLQPSSCALYLFPTKVVTDNATAFVAAGRILMTSYRTIYWTPCAAHCLDLLVEDIGKIQWINMALAQDQLRVLTEMVSGLDLNTSMGIYDGDTLQTQRMWLRDNARLLITNPDMLHISILPSHKQFQRILSNLRFIILDEAHAYKGAFGCHTALILRRLTRICFHLYGTTPKFIISSATIANPREHALKLANLQDVHVVLEDGSPCGSKVFLLWNPPLKLDHQQIVTGKSKRQKVGSIQPPYVEDPKTKRASPILEASYILTEFVQHGLRCIAFCNSRKLSELVLNYTQEALKRAAPHLINSVCVYRAGYMVQERRKIERDLFLGKLRGVAATNALELGIDVGNLDATLHLGFPGSVASLWQQAGRAGRREKSSLSVYVAFEGPLDQHFMRNPHKLFSRPIEHAHIDVHNPQVIEQHLPSAALEFPINLFYDESYFGSGLSDAILQQRKKGYLGMHTNGCPENESYHYIGSEKHPSSLVSIRAIDPEKYRVVNQATNDVIEEIEESKAFFEVYEGAVYMHQGITYLVTHLDLSAKVAVCQKSDLKYYTKTRDFTDVYVTGGDLAYPGKVLGSTTAQVNLCKVTTKWIGFRKIWRGSNLVFDTVDLFLPEYSYESQAVWVRVPCHVRTETAEHGLCFRAGLHAACHALLNILPLYIPCNHSDMGSECANPHDRRFFPERLLLFDRHAGGIGLAAQALQLFPELLQAALNLIVTCECSNSTGCPNCIQNFSCGEYNEVIDKHAATIILKGVCKAEETYREGKL